MAIRTMAIISRAMMNPMLKNITIADISAFAMMGITVEFTALYLYR